MAEIRFYSRRTTILIMAYSLSEIKIFAYNCDEKPDFTEAERNLFIGLAFCYECYRSGHDKKVCESLMENYIRFYKYSQILELDMEEGDTNSE